MPSPGYRRRPNRVRWLGHSLGRPRDHTSPGRSYARARRTLGVGGLPGVLRSQAVGGVSERREPPLALLAGFQYWPEPSWSAVPPTPVTSGTWAGESTANPARLLEVPDRQSAPPESPA